MRNNDRAADNQTDGEAVENLRSSGVERENAVDQPVPFIETLDPQTRAELDEVLMRSTMLARSVIAALNRP
jgi:hypothetical protein